MQSPYVCLSSTSGTCERVPAKELLKENKCIGKALSLQKIARSAHVGLVVMLQLG